MARKGYPFSKRSEKQMTNLISSILAGLIAAPLSGVGKGSDNDAIMSVKEATDWVLFMVIIATPFALYLIVESFLYDDDITFGCIYTVLLVLMWVCVFFQVRKYKRSKNKENK